MLNSREDKIRALKIAQLNELKNRELSGTTFDDSEMPEWLDPSDRTTVKNLANNTNESINYLKSRYPDSDFAIKDGGIFGKKKGEAHYKALDPSFSPISNPMATIKDLWNDTKDLGMDALQLGAEGAGAALGAVGGSIPGLMAGTAAGAGAASTLREALRKKLGVADEMSLGTIAGDALISGSLAGLIPGAAKGVRKLAPKLYSKATGISEDGLRMLADRGDELSRVTEQESLGRISKATTLAKDAIKGRIDDVASKYAAAGKDAPLVNLRGYMNAIDDEISTLAREAADAPGNMGLKEQLEAALKMRDSLIDPNVSPLATDIRGVLRITDDLSDKMSFTDAMGKGLKSSEERVAGRGREAIKSAMNDAAPDRAALDSTYKSDVIDFQAMGKKFFKDDSTTQSTLKRLGTGKDKVLDGWFAELPEPTKKQILTLKSELEITDRLSGINRARNITSDNFLNEAGGGLVGRTPLEVTLTALGGGLGYTTGGQVGAVLGATTGRGIGKFVTSPKSLLRTAKAGKKVGGKLKSLDELLEKNPQFRALLGSGAGATAR